MFNLSMIIDSSAKNFPNKTAVVFNDQRFVYSQINALSNRIANGLVKAGIKRGDKVALSCPNLPYFPIIYYGILKAGAVVVPLNVLLKSKEIAYHLNDSDAKAYFCFQGTPELPMAEEGFKGFQEAEACENFIVMTNSLTDPSPIQNTKTMGQFIAAESDNFDTIETDSQDTAVILYTSGTTGHPKGAELTHSNMIMNTFISIGIQELVYNDIEVVALPLFHSFGQTAQMNASLAKGATIVLIPRFAPDAVLKAIVKEKATLFLGVPTMFWALLNYKDNEEERLVEKASESLRAFGSGGSALPLEIFKGIEKKFGVLVLEGYGLSETSPIATFGDMNKESKPGSIGTSVFGVEVKLVDIDNKDVPCGEIGEIVIRGHNVMKGYYNKPEATQKAIDRDGWFHTGDLAKMDEEGYFYIVDRVKDMIIRGGFNVYPREIEEVLMTHPAISLVAVIGAPDAEHGEEIKACIVLKPDVKATEEEIMEWSKENMANYKYPRIIEIYESLPMTSTGKILKRELRS